MNLLYTQISAIPVAFALDAIIGDPTWFPHPVRVIGKIITYTEKLAKKYIRNDFTGGAITAATVILLTALSVWFILYTAALIGKTAEYIASVILLYFGIACRDLHKSALIVSKHLKNNDIDNARTALSKIVGRDTQNLDKIGIIRAVIETIAENTVDGIISPLFFAILAGPMGIWIFKAISTCDSMLGYKNEKYKRFGTFAAKIDDAANFIPARIMFILFPIAALIMPECNVFSCIKTGWKEWRFHSSPNAGIPEALIAGALRISLAGPVSYHGKIQNKPFFGKQYPQPEIKHIYITLAFMWISSILFLSISVYLKYLFVII